MATAECTRKPAAILRPRPQRQSRRSTRDAVHNNHVLELLNVVERLPVLGDAILEQVNTKTVLHGEELEKHKRQLWTLCLQLHEVRSKVEDIKMTPLSQSRRRP